MRQHDHGACKSMFLDPTPGGMSDICIAIFGWGGDHRQPPIRLEHVALVALLHILDTSSIIFYYYLGKF